MENIKLIFATKVFFFLDIGCTELEYFCASN